MKKMLLLSSAFSLFALASQAQFGDLIKQVKNTDSSAKAGLAKISGGKTTGLSNDEIISGLKEALNVGTGAAAGRLSAADGFFKDAAVKILMPKEAQQVESKLRSFGMGKQVDQAILSMNRAAEDAAKEITPIFLSAIKGMTIQDGVGILRGNEVAATTYLKDKTTSQLTEKFRPVIETSLKKVDATKHWNTVFTAYNQFSSEKVNTDLVAYVTEKALAGVFYQVGQEEQKIRKDPAARTTEILKKVFSN